MRIVPTLALAAVCCLAPARAQASFSPLVGYDIDAEGFTIGLAAELGTTIGALPLAPSIRPSIEYIFADSDVTYVRGDVDLIGRFSPSPGVQPYVKLGPTIEYVSVDVLGSSSSNTEVGLNLGAGAEFNRLFVEGAFGLGDISELRVRAGYRF